MADQVHDRDFFWFLDRCDANGMMVSQCEGIEATILNSQDSRKIFDGTRTCVKGGPPLSMGGNDFERRGTGSSPPAALTTS